MHPMPPQQTKLLVASESIVDELAWDADLPPFDGGQMRRNYSIKTRLPFAMTVMVIQFWNKLARRGMTIALPSKVTLTFESI